MTYESLLGGSWDLVAHSWSFLPTICPLNRPCMWSWKLGPEAVPPGPEPSSPQRYRDNKYQQVGTVKPATEAHPAVLGRSRVLQIEDRVPRHLPKQCCTLPQSGLSERDPHPKLPVRPELGSCSDLLEGVCRHPCRIQYADLKKLSI